MLKMMMKKMYNGFSPNYLGLILSDVYFFLTSDSRYDLEPRLRNELRLWYYHCRKAGYVPFVDVERTNESLLFDVHFTDLHKESKSR